MTETSSTDPAVPTDVPGLLAEVLVQLKAIREQLHRVEVRLALTQPLPRGVPLEGAPPASDA